MTLEVFKYMALYSVCEFCSATVLFYDLDDMTSWAYYHIDVFTILPLSFAMSMTATYDHLTKHRPIDRLMSLPILLSVIGQTGIQITFQVLYIKAA